MWLAAMVGAALASSCDPEALSPPPETLSVAWVSPLPRRAHGWLEVVRTRDAARQGDVGRMLQALGRRRKDTAPRRRYKVVVFDVSATALCRGVAGVEEGAVVGGVRACADRLTRSTRSTDGCGHVVDRADDSAGVEVFRARWRDLAREGFCVLPAERFVVGQ